MGADKVKAMLALMIDDLLQFFNVGKTMNAAQVAMTVNLITEKYPQYKIEDFKFCFKNAMSGEYGKIFDRIDGSLIFEWFNKYLDSREEAFESFQARQKRLRDEVVPTTKNDDLTDPENAPIPCPPELMTELKNMVPKVGKLGGKTPKISDPNLDKWLAEFDVMYRKEGSGSGGKRYVTYNGLKLDIDEFLKVKSIEQGEQKNK